MVLLRDRHTDQYRRIQSPEIEPRKYEGLIFDKCAKVVHGQRIVSLTNGAGTTGYQEENKTQPKPCILF